MTGGQQCTSDPDLPQCDPDGDLLLNQQEDNRGTDRHDADSDDDGLKDGLDVSLADPLVPDTDDDGLKDGFEVNKSSTFPKDGDSDNDGLSDFFEVCDSDFSFKSGQEYAGNNYSNICSGAELGWYACDLTVSPIDCTNTGTDPNDSDTDRQITDPGLNDGDEYYTDLQYCNPKDGGDDDKCKELKECKPFQDVTAPRVQNMGVLYFGDSQGTAIAPEEKTCVDVDLTVKNENYGQYVLHDLRKWTWSDNVGWISFNCNDPTIFGQSDYCDIQPGGVKAVFNLEEPTVGYLTDYAWSQKTGWIKFNWIDGKLPNGWSNSAKTGGEYCDNHQANSECGTFKDFIPKMSQVGENWSLQGYAWSQRAGWVSLNGAYTTDWNSLGLWAKVEVVKAMSYDILGQAGDGLMEFNGTGEMMPNGDINKDYSRFAVAGLPLVAEKNTSNCSNTNTYNDEEIDPTEKLDQACRWPASGYAIKVGLGAGLGDETLASQIVETSRLIVNMATDGGVYSKQATTSGDIANDIGSISALRLGPTGYATDGGFVKIACDRPKLGTVLSSPCLATRDDEGIDEGKLTWVRTLTSAAPSHTEGLDFMNEAAGNDFKITSIDVSLEYGLPGHKKTVPLTTISGETLNLCPDGVTSTSPDGPKLCGVYKGQFRFKPPVQFVPKQIYGTYIRDFITAYLDQPLKLQFLRDREKLAPWYSTQAILNNANLINIFGGYNLTTSLKTANNSVDFIFDKNRDGKFDTNDGATMGGLINHYFPVGTNDYSSFGLYAGQDTGNTNLYSWGAMVIPKNETDRQNNTSEIIDKPELNSVISYTVGAKDPLDTSAPFEVRYAPGILPKPGIVGLGSDPLVDVKGAVSLKTGITGRGVIEEDKKINSIGDMSTSLLRDQVVKNVAKLTSGFTQHNNCIVAANYSSPGRTDSRVSISFDATNKYYKFDDTNIGCTSSDNSVLYVKCNDCDKFSEPYVVIAGTNDLTMNQTIILEGMNVFVRNNILDTEDQKTLGMIVLGKKNPANALPNWYYGGNLYLTGPSNNGIEGIDAVYMSMFLDGSLMRYEYGRDDRSPDTKWLCGMNNPDVASEGNCDETTPGVDGQRFCKAITDPNYRQQCLEEPAVIVGPALEKFLANQIYIKGFLSSGAVKGGNTIGGTDKDPPILGGGTKLEGAATNTGGRTSVNVERASLYDINRLSYFKLSYARCGYQDTDGSPGMTPGDIYDYHTIDLKTGNCEEVKEGNTNITSKPFDFITLEGDLVVPNNTNTAPSNATIDFFKNFYQLCQDTTDGCARAYTDIGAIYFDVDFPYPYAPRRSQAWRLVKNQTDKEILTHNAPVYFEYVEPKDLPGFEGAGGAATVQY